MALDIRTMFTEEESAGLSFLESWAVKVMAAEDALVQQGDMPSPTNIVLVHDIQAGPGDPMVCVEVELKTGRWNAATRKWLAIPVDLFNSVLNASWPPRNPAAQKRLATLLNTYRSLS